MNCPGNHPLVSGESVGALIDKQRRFIMFACIVEINPRPERKEELVTVLRKEVLPILKNQPGFLEILPFAPVVTTEKMVTITLWTEKRDAERYEREAFHKVEGILKPYLATTPVISKHYNVETSLCQHFVAALTA
jgi:heme-degrading monooxygenase HmoA